MLQSLKIKGSSVIYSLFFYSVILVSLYLLEVDGIPERVDSIALFSVIIVAIYLHVHLKYNLLKLYSFPAAFFSYSFFFYWISFYLIWAFSPTILSKEIYIISLVSIITFIFFYDLLNIFVPSTSELIFLRKVDSLRFKYSKKTSVIRDLIIISFFLSLVFTTLFFVKAGGIPMLASNPEVARVEAMKGSGTFHRISYLTLHIGSILSSLLFVLSKSRKIFFFFLIAALLALYNMLTGPRYSALLALFYIYISFQLFSYGKIKLVATMFLIGILLFIVGVVGGIRYSGLSQYDSQQAVLLFINRVYMNPINANRIYEHYKVKAITPNSLMIDAKVLLPGSQPDLGTYLKDEMGVEFDGGGITVPFPVEGYMNMKIWGLILYSLLLALIFKFFESFILIFKASPLVIVFVLMMSVQWMGSITMGISGILIKSVLPTIVVFFLVWFIYECLKLVSIASKILNNKTE